MIPLRRGVQILTTALRYRLDTIPQALQIDHWTRYLFPTSLLPTPQISEAKRCRLAIERLGPVFIKFGQLLSTRRDLLPEEYADELARLQDRVPPFPSAMAISTIETEIGRPLTDSFATFSEQPLASASLAQVHEATLTSGEEVVVKVIRPGIAGVIKKDLALILALAKLLERFFSDARRLHLIRVVEDYEKTILAELDLLRESANTVRLQRNFETSPLLYVPKVYNDLSSVNVLVMERVKGVPISDLETLRRRGTDLKKLAERGVETFFVQVFNDNFFHADMHPGNIFVDVSDPANPSYIAIDCAIIGQLTKEDQAYLARNIVAFFNEDYAEIAKLHTESGWISAKTDAREFESTIRQLCQPFFQRPLAEISFGSFLIALFSAARRFDMEVQPQLVLLQKTLLNIEGLGRQLYPDLNLWATAKPFMEKWMREHYGPGAILKTVVDQGPGLIELLPRIPELLITGSRQLPELGRLAVEQKQAMENLTSALLSERRRRRRARVAGAVLVVAGLGLLWESFMEVIAIGGDNMTATAGIAATLVGSVLVGRG
ncbi:MAG TPA: ubiquinone biosynthesis regulatory protein kinase UbiB [Pseudomonadales bacterium]|nr:ubiquinone biosynthesis regulatory protein kinase UbiB [Gammaproteobacteria bacterium]HIM36033.1 ubiquinone biosynthesis regulatory protein kinase UbiB [Pseudomonadales bacterium]